MRDLKNIENIASYKVNDFLQFPQFIMLFQPIEKNVSLVKILLVLSDKLRTLHCTLYLTIVCQL